MTIKGKALPKEEALSEAILPEATLPETTLSETTLSETTSPKEETPLQRLYHWESTTPKRVFLRQAHEGSWIDYTWQQVGDRARRLAAYLRAQDFPEGSRIAIYAKNCADWFFADLAIMLSGHVSVPLYLGQAQSAMQYILEHSETQLVFVGECGDVDSLLDVLPDGVKTVAIHGAQRPFDEGIDNILNHYAPMSDNPSFPMDKIFTIMYTSGTTGNPKGVMHDYAIVAFAVPRLIRTNSYTHKDRFISYLPLSHAAERIIVEMQSLYSSATVHFVQNQETFAADLKRTRPTFFFSVPRLWKKFKEGVETKLPPEKLNKMLAVPGLSYWVKKKIQRELGLDKAKILLTGAAPTPLDIQEWFINLGMPLLDGYGMTENFIYGCTCKDGPVPGTVGTPHEDCEVLIGENDEVLFKSKALMRGYYLEPEKTAQVLRNGCYHTGDTGRIDENGNLIITGRLSEVFKTTKGKFVQPISLENGLGESSLLGQICVLGHGLDQPVVLANLSELALTMERNQVAEQLETLVHQLNEPLATHEQVRHVFIVKDEWSIDNELLTPTMKMKRQVIDKRYRSWVESQVDSDTVVVWEKA